MCLVDMLGETSLCLEAMAALGAGVEGLSDGSSISGMSVDLPLVHEHTPVGPKAPGAMGAGEPLLMRWVVVFTVRD